MTTLPLTPDELLSTTRAVRKRLDLSRPVDRTVIEECIRLAQQAPNASNREGWHFICVTDPDLRQAIAALYRQGADQYFSSPLAPSDRRLIDSARFLADNLAEVPVLVIPCIEGRTEGASSAQQSARWGTIAPAVWSFMLAARARGLGTAWTTFHLRYEREAAELLNIPYDDVMQAALIPVAYSVGTEFQPATRAPLDQILHWERWP
jgi:nitroreductase